MSFWQLTWQDAHAVGLEVAGGIIVSPITFAAALILVGCAEFVVPAYLVFLVLPAVVGHLLLVGS